MRLRIECSGLVWALTSVLYATGALGAAVIKPSPAEPVSLRVEADEAIGELKPLWRFFGYDEPNYTYAPEGEQLLDEIALLNPQPAYIRCHHLLTSGDGTPWLKWGSTGVYAEDAEGKPVFSWTLVDRIFDTFHERGLKPFVQFAFMPEALSATPEPYTPGKIFRGEPKGMVGGGAFRPPKDYAKWGAFIEAYVNHCVQRYGRAEAESWWWELWNEPDIGYWEGTPDEYIRLYDHTAAAVKRALPSARVGGPHVTNPTSPKSEALLRRFLEHCLRGTNAATGGKGAPLDFIAFHAKGGTAFTNGYVRMNAGNHLRIVDRGCAIVASYPELRGKPVVIGESDPDGCAACSSSVYPQNGYRNGAQYASYTAATFLRKQAVAARHGVSLEGAVTWAFTFPDQPWFDGFRELATHGIPKPVFNAFRMFSQLEKQQVRVRRAPGRTLDDVMARSVRAEPDVDAVATRGRDSLVILMWHYHDLGAPGAAVSVQLSITGLPRGVESVRLSHWRIDDEHSNAYTAWLKMGSPQEPTIEQYAAIEDASALQELEPERELEGRGGSWSLDVELPRQSLSLIRVGWDPATP